MSIIEIIAVVFSLLSVILTIKNNIWCWPVGIIGIASYYILFAQNAIWGNTILQIVFLLQSIIGWYNWNKESKYPISWMKNGSREAIIGITILLSVSIYTMIDNKNGVVPILDSITTTLSLVAMVLMSYRKIESWIFWILADLLYMAFFFSIGLYLSTFVYLVFLILAIIGLREWNMSLKER